MTYIPRVRRDPRMMRKMQAVYDAMGKLRDFLKDYPLQPHHDAEDGLIHYPWPDEMKQLIADYIVAAEPIIPVWESIKVRVERGMKAKEKSGQHRK